MQLWLPALVTFCYLLSAGGFWQVHRNRFSPFWALTLLVITCQLHAIVLISTISSGTPRILNLSIFNVISIFAWMIACLSLFWLWRVQMSLAGVMISLINAVLVPIAALLVARKPFLENLSTGMVWHILLSIAAWTFLSIAMIHAILYTHLFQRLKQKRLRNANMGSLAGMERIMIWHVSVGWGLLAMSLLTGLAFVEDLFAQHLWHKTVLTVLAWLVFSRLVWLYFYRRRHGMILVYWLFAGYALLMTGYVVSNIVLQFIV